MHNPLSSAAALGGTIEPVILHCSTSRQLIFSVDSLLLVLGRLIRCFSLWTAWSSLLSSDDNTHRTGYLNGLKLLLCLWIASGHLIIFPSPEFTRECNKTYPIHGDISLVTIILKSVFPKDSNRKYLIV